MIPQLRDKDGIFSGPINNAVLVVDAPGSLNSIGAGSAVY